MTEHVCDWCGEPPVRSREVWGGEAFEDGRNYSGWIRWYACQQHLKQLESKMSKQKDPRPRKDALPPTEKLFDDGAFA